MALLEIKNLHVEIDGKEILKGLDLTVNAGEVHAIMGPNGSGKSTLAYVLAGKADYTPTAGEVLFNGKNLFDMAPDERAAAGLFLAFQYPLEIPGVATMTFLRTALNAQRKKRGEAELSTPEFIKKVRELAGKLGIEQDMLRRAVNVGFSGGEKKRNEILQMALLEPRLAVLDETNSGLDIDALKIVADGVNRLRSPQRVLRRHHALPAAAGLHRARHRARAVERPHRQDRRQGTGARARSARLCRVSGRGGGVNAEVTIIKTAAETALAQAFAQARARLPGDDAVAAQRDAAFDVFAKEGLPHRRVEEWKYTDLRALMRDAKPLASPPDAAAKARAKDRRRIARRCRGAPAGLRRRRVRCRTVRYRELGKRPLRSARWPRRLSDGDPALAAHLGKLAPAERRRGRAQYRVDGRRRGDPHRRRLDHRAAAASAVRRVGKARRDFRALARRRRGAARAPC